MNNPILSFGWDFFRKSFLSFVDIKNRVDCHVCLAYISTQPPPILSQQEHWDNTFMIFIVRGIWHS